MIQISDKNCYLNITNFTVPGYFLFSTKCSRKFLHLQLSARFTGAILELTERFMAFQRHQTAMISAFVAPSRGQLAIDNNVTRHHFKTNFSAAKDRFRTTCPTCKSYFEWKLRENLKINWWRCPGENTFSRHLIIFTKHHFFFKNKVYEMTISDFENWISPIFGGRGWGGGGGILKKSRRTPKFIHLCNIGLKLEKLVSQPDTDYTFDLFIH